MTKRISLSEKRILRKFLNNRRSEKSEIYESKNNAHIHLKPLIQNIKNETIGTYINFRNELDTKKLNQYLIKQNINIALPVIDFENQEMNFFKYDDNTELVKNKYCILEPKYQEQIIFPKKILIPLLGYSLNGQRLGYGGGYYDKYFAKHGEQVQKIGLGFTFQEVKDLPTEKHDVRLDWILSEKHLYKVR